MNRVLIVPETCLMIQEPLLALTHRQPASKPLSSIMVMIMMMMMLMMMMMMMMIMMTVLAMVMIMMMILAMVKLFRFRSAVFTIWLYII